MDAGLFDFAYTISVQEHFQEGVPFQKPSHISYVSILPIQEAVPRFVAWGTASLTSLKALADVTRSVLEIMRREKENAILQF